MGHTMIHLNNNLLCAIDIFTTGWDCYKDSIFGFCCLPLDSFIKVYKNTDSKRKIVPFDVMLIPGQPQYICLHDKEYIKSLPKRTNKRNLIEALNTGFDSMRAADLFEQWFLQLKLCFRKQIIPLSYDWVRKEPFIRQWLGNETYNQFFSFHYRDLFVATNFVNDRADFRNEPIPYPKNHLFKYIMSQLKIETERVAHLIDNCQYIAEAYRRIICGEFY